MPVETTPARWNSLRGASPSCVYGALTNASSGDAWLSLFSEYRGPTTVGYTNSYTPSVGTSSSVYLSSTAMVSPGSTLATFIVKTLGRLCSSSDALFPSRFAASNSVLRLLALLDFGDDAHIADGHRHAVDRRARRRRKHVAGMNGPRSAILVHLPNGHVRDHPGDRDVDARVLQRQAIDGGISTLDEEVWRERLVSGRAIRPAPRRRAARATAWRQKRGRSELKVSCDRGEQRRCHASNACATTTRPCLCGRYGI